MEVGTVERLQSLLNFTNADGEVITFFDGKVTLSQLVVCIIAFLVIIYAFKVLKGIFRTIVLIASICIALVHYGIASPTQIKNVASQVAQNGLKAYKSFEEASDNIKIEGSNIKIKLEEEWVNVSDISSYIVGEDGVVTVTVDGVQTTIEDEAIISLLNTFK